MDSYRNVGRWLVLCGVTLVLVWLSGPRNTLFGLGVVAGVAAGSHRAAYRQFTSETVSTAVATLSTGLFVGAVSVALVSAWRLPTLSTATLGYAIGVLAAWLLISGASVEELGPFAAIGGLLIAVFGGAGGLLIVPDSTLFVALLFAGLVGGVVIPLSALAISAVTSRSARRSAEREPIKPATRFGIEATAVAGVAIVVPFGSRAVALFGHGGAGWFPVGLLGGVMLSVSLWSVDGRSERLTRVRDWFVERVYQLLDRLTRWVERRRNRGSHSSLNESADGEGGGEAAAAGDESLSNASGLVDRAASRVADHEFVRMAAEEIDSMAAANNGLRDRVGMFWGRLSGAIERQRLATGATLQLSAAETAHDEGDTERARSLADTALQLAAPTIGTAAAAVVRGRRQGFERVFDGLAPLFSRIDALLADEQFVDQETDPEGFGLIQQLLERLVETEAGEGFDSALSTIRAAAADGWYSVQAGDQALTNDNYQRALVAYLSAINAYRRAYDIATEAKKTATAERKTPDGEKPPAGGDPRTTDGDHTVTAAAGTYAAEASRIETALEALLYDTAALTIAAVDDLYGTEPPPTVDTDGRRTIVRTLRVLRQTRSRTDSAVPVVDLADDRYQRAEIARSVARIRRHLAAADETAKRGNVEAAVEQYDRAADRLDVLSNRAGNAGLADVARRLVSTAAVIGEIASDPTAEAISQRPELSVPSTDDQRAPAAVPAGRRLRRTFCEPAFVELWEFTEEAAAHPVLDFAGEPYPELVGAVNMALGTLDPIYSRPDVASLQEWVDDTTLDALAAAVETVAESHRELCELDQIPSAFRAQPTVLDDELAASVPTAEGVDVFADAWLSRADALADAGETIQRRQAAVDGFAALEGKVRNRLDQRGWLGTSQVSAELLEVAASQLEGVAYDADRQRLSKTGEISRRDRESPTDESVVDGPLEDDSAVDESPAEDSTTGGSSENDLTGRESTGDASSADPNSSD